MAQAKKTRTLESDLKIARAAQRGNLLTRASKLPAILLFGALAISASEPQLSSIKPIADRGVPAGLQKGQEIPTVSYIDGQLSINAYDVTLAEVLQKVAALTGVLIDLPEGANRERMPIVKFGPGSAREVLASLLSDSSFDYMIQASDTDSEMLQSVLLMPRKKKGSTDNGTGEVAVARNSRFRAPQQAVEEAQAPDAAQRTPESSPSEAAASNPQPPSPPSDISLSAAAAQRTSSDGLRPGAMTPPATLNSGSINQQLQQMYQQRVQMNQQNNQTASPGGLK